MTKASATKAFRSRTNTTTKTMVSTISRKLSLFSIGGADALALAAGLVATATGPGLPLLGGGASAGASVVAGACVAGCEGILALGSAISITSAVRSLVGLEHGQEGFLRNRYLPHVLHALLPGCLLGPQLALTGDIAPVAFCRHVFLDRGDRLAADDPTANGRLDSDLEEVAFAFAAQFLNQFAAASLANSPVHDS